MAKRNGRWEDAGKFSLDVWSPLDSQVVKLVPMSAAPASAPALAATSSHPSASHSVEALQMTMAAGDGSIHTVTLDLSNARKLSQMILNRLAEYGDATAQEIVSVIQRRKPQDRAPLDDREAA